ncbi:MAG: acetolactate synthase large subunit [Chloroflexi bacterium]|nr:acetolactate synthase large subunit [Chloroflexota bacterium]
MRAADLLVRCLEEEGVEYVFGVPGEEILDLLDALSRSPIQCIATRHEQGAAFMADVHGRLTGRAGVCLATLGPGASNLLTGVANAYMDRSPLVAITGQASTERRHKEYHQYVSITHMFQPVTKWNATCTSASTIPEIVRKAFRIAQAEKPGATHIELPENVAQMDTDGEPLRSAPPTYSSPVEAAVERAASIVREANNPIVLAGHGVIRRRATDQLTALVDDCALPLCHTFMGSGAIDASHPLCLLSVGLQRDDSLVSGLDRADVVIAVGYDMAEYAPDLWNPGQDKVIIHVDTAPAEVDAHYQPAAELIGELGESLTALRMALGRRVRPALDVSRRDELLAELHRYDEDPSFPMKPQRILADVRRALGDQDLLVCDVGAHKLWAARLYPAHRPNTVLISNGYAAMGFAVPGAIAAKLVHPDRRVLALTGDGGFLMNSQEMETAKRLGTSFVILIWVDGGYGSIAWKQMARFGRTFAVDFGNPDFVAYAQSFGLPGLRVDSADGLLPALQQAFDLPAPVVVQVPVDYSENRRLTEKLGALTLRV